MASKKLLLPLIGLTLSALIPAVAGADTWRWTDKHGNVHFSDKPPEDAKTSSEEVEVKGPPPIGQGEEVRAIRERTLRLFEAEAEERRKQQQEQQKEQRKQALRKHQCDRVREQLRVLEGPVKYVDEDGNRYDVSEERVAADRERLKRWIEANCS